MHQAHRTPLGAFDTHKCVTLDDACFVHHYRHSPVFSSQSMGRTRLCLSIQRQCHNHGYLQTHVIRTGHVAGKTLSLATQCILCTPYCIPTSKIPGDLDFIVCKFQNQNDKNIPGKENTGTQPHPRCIAQIHKTCTRTCSEYECT